MNRSFRLFHAWLGTGILLVLGMIVAGGVTRLTGSGLSMVEWKLILDMVPPVSAEEWGVAFEKYRQFPEYRIVNAGMNLDEFWFIYFWEYLHRFLGRVTGIVFLIPALFFILAGKVPAGYKKHLLFVFLLGALQAAAGWFMVKSGLFDQPHVSHFRLTIHLLLAVILAIYLFILRFNLRHPEIRYFAKRRGLLHVLSFTLIILLIVQISSGGFMAGLKAALSYPDYPLMGGKLIPSFLFYTEKGMLEFLSNSVFVNFFHRHFPFLIVSIAAFLYIPVRRLRLHASGKRIMHSACSLWGVLFVQVALGVATLMNSTGDIPLLLGVLHQLTGVVLILTAVNFYLNVRLFNTVTGYT